jgi:tetratricopeptide (TPR) repeat protein
MAADVARRDFFISHAGRDRAWAEWVASHLNNAGYTVELDSWDWAPGDNFILKMSEELDKADRVAALMSPAYFEPSRYTTEEWAAALVKDDNDRHWLLPLRIAPCELPTLLRPLIRVDLFGVSEDEALRRLLAAARGPARPDGAPEFPPSQADGHRNRPASAGSAPRIPGSLPRIWNVQPRNPAFVGRDTELAELRNQLLAGGTAVARALHGFGGVGKTQLAVEYAHRFCGAYELVWWITADRPELVATQLAVLAVAAGAAVEAAETPAAVSALHLDLRRRDGWLLIFDNAEDPKALRQWLPDGPGHVLITSRNPNWGEIAAPVNVKVFAPGESVALLRNRVPDIAVVDAEHIAAELDNFPLALAQAAGVLSETGLPAAAYLEYLAGHASEALDDGAPTYHSRSLTATVSDATDRLADADPAAVALLQLAAFFGPEPIPIAFFGEVAGLPAPLVTVVVDPVKLHRTFGRIASYGLARLDQAGIQVHRLVQAIIRDRLPDGQRHEQRDVVAALLVAVGPSDTDNPAVWPAWAGLLPHLLAANPAESGSTELRQLSARALLYLLRRGDSVTAENFAATLYKRWAERLGPDDPDTLAAATELAHAYWAHGRLADALALVEDTLARRRSILGEDNPATLRSASDLAQTMGELGELQQARVLAEDALAKRRDALGPDHPETLRTASNLSATLSALGEYEAARELAEDTLTRLTQVLGPDYPNTLVTVHILAVALSGLGEYPAACEIAEEALAKQRQILGANHSDTLATAGDLGMIMAESGNLFGGRKLLEQTLIACRKNLGADHPLTKLAAKRLDRVRLMLGGLSSQPTPKPKKKRKK